MRSIKHNYVLTPDLDPKSDPVTVLPDALVRSGNSRAIHLYAVLAHFPVSHPHGRPSLAVLGALTGFAPATLKKHLDLLEAMGWIYRLSKQAAGGGADASVIVLNSEPHERLSRQAQGWLEVNRTAPTRVLGYDEAQAS